MKHYPRLLDPQRSFDAIVDWLYNDVIISRGCPGLIVGLSGTDSLVAFLAASKAFDKAGKPNRVFGVHFAPSEDFLYDHPEAETHLWFSKEVIPWLKKQAPKATIIVDDSIDWRYDGLRWGKLADMSVIFIIDRAGNKRVMRIPEDQFWMMGTRNRTEDVMNSYSNASTMVSLQPIIHLWKSEVLRISKQLDIPEVAIAKSCEVDCICGRMRLPANHPQELDLLLMDRVNELSEEYVKRNVPVGLRVELDAFITSQTNKGAFKASIPYKPDYTTVHTDPLVGWFEDGSLDLRAFNHRLHIYVARYYLKGLPFKDALDRYVVHLRQLLDINEQSHRFNFDITESYFHKIDAAMLECGNVSFDELIYKASYLLKK